MDKTFDAPVQYLKGIGPKRAKEFKKIGIESIDDFLYYFPRRYEDRTNFVDILELKEGVTQTIKAQVLARLERRSFKRRGLTITEVVVQDQSGKIPCIWFNQPYIKDYLKVGENLILFGRIERYGKRLQMNSPEFEIIHEADGASLDINRLVPIYSIPEGMSQRYFRKIVKGALDEYLPKIKEFLPYDIRAKNNLLNLAKALLGIHFPDNLEAQKEAYRRLSFDEFFLFQILLVLRKLKKKDKFGLAHNTDSGLVKAFIEKLPFELTEAQKRVVNEIKLDMSKPQAMQRLLQGDVGSGKTVVSIIASLIAIGSGYQVAFMVPTEILARQHLDKISCQLSAISYQKRDIKIGLLVGSLKAKEKEKLCKEIREGAIDLLIGTHALLEEEVSFKNLGLVVIDEQHKFGVGQRSLLPKKGPNPDVLIMTATPIPRTLAITLYGDLDISIINEMPVGRKPVKTLSFSESEKLKAYDIAKAQLKLKKQTYIIYPVIEESYTLDIAGAKKMYAELKKGYFKEFKVGLIHGKLRDQEQAEIMLKFKRKELDLLVSTTVLEVGIDIPNATCMIIEHAERFGLAQLHQLRGRVGRGIDESICVLLSDTYTQEAKSRIAAMVKHSDGFRIAEEDLKIRGPGEFFGKRQHGLTELRIANPLTQMQLLKRAREEAIKLLDLDRYFKARTNVLLKDKLLQRFRGLIRLEIVS